MPSYVPAKKNTAYVTYVALIDQASGKLFKAAPTLAVGDVQVSIDGGAFANLATLPTVVPAAGKQVRVNLSAAEMNGDRITVLFSDVAGAEWNDLFVNVETAARQLDDLAFPTVSGRSLDVTATGAAGLDWANVEAQGTAVTLSATTISSSQVVASVTGAVGSVTGSVGSVTGSVGSVTGSVGSVTGAVGSVAANGITAASIATGAIDADALATDAVNEIADGVWDEPLAGHLTAGSTGAALNGAGAAGDPWTTLLPGAYGAGTAGNIVGTRLDVAVSTRLAPTVPGRTLDVTTTGGAGIDWANVEAQGTAVALTATTISSTQVVASVTGSVGSVTGAVGSVTGSVGSVTGAVGSVAGNVTGNVTGSVGSVAANGITATSLDPTAGAEIADAVWDEAIAGHLAAGSTGAALNAAGAAGDPWATPLPGVYGAGTAGNIVGVNLNATVSSRATQVSVDAVAGFVDTEVAAILAAVVPGVADIKAKTDNLPPDPADNSVILGAIAGLPAAPSAVVIADTLLNRDMAAVSDTNPRSPLNALRRLRNKNDAAVTPGSIVIYKENDTTIAYVATLTTDAGAAPVTVFDPTT